MAVREPDVSPLTRHLVHAFLLVFAIAGLAHLELLPFSGFRLFSEVRGPVRTTSQLYAVDSDGTEVPIVLDELSLGYRQSWRLIAGMAHMSDAERDEICDAWAHPLRERGVEVTSIRIYKTVDDMRPDGPPSERSLRYECGGAP